MVRLPLSLFLLGVASLDDVGPSPDLPLVIAGFCVAAALMATVVLDLIWLGRRSGGQTSP